MKKGQLTKQHKQAAAKIATKPAETSAKPAATQQKFLSKLSHGNKITHGNGL
jgi:hypothetical protein